MQYFTRSAGTNLIEKATCRNKSLLLAMGYEKDVFAFLRMNFNPCAFSEISRFRSI